MQRHHRLAAVAIACLTGAGAFAAVHVSNAGGNLPRITCLSAAPCVPKTPPPPMPFMRPDGSLDTRNLPSQLPLAPGGQALDAAGNIVQRAGGPVIDPVLGLVKDAVQDAPPVVVPNPVGRPLAPPVK